jgi:hypothetical protein
MKFEELVERSPRRYGHLHLCEESTGDSLSGTRRCFDCFEVEGRGGRVEDCRWIGMAAGSAVDCYDVWGTGDGAELCYHSGPVCWAGRMMHFCLNTHHSTDLLYCDSCSHCSHCFGCIGLRHQQYCILNQQYDEAEYFSLVRRIIRTMQKTHEWAEFLPPSAAPHAYNDSTASFYYPLPKEEVLKRGFRWSSYEPPFPSVARSLKTADIPDHIAEVDDSYLNVALICKDTGKPFRLTRQELDFYRRFSIPVPRLHPAERRARRGKKLTPWRLYKRNCSGCGKEVFTAYTSRLASSVICDGCFLA